MHCIVGTYPNGSPRVCAGFWAVFFIIQALYLFTLNPSSQPCINLHRFAATGRINILPTNVNVAQYMSGVYGERAGITSLTIRHLLSSRLESDQHIGDVFTEGIIILT